MSELRIYRGSGQELRITWSRTAGPGELDIQVWQAAPGRQWSKLKGVTISEGELALLRRFLDTLGQGERDLPEAEDVRGPTRGLPNDDAHEEFSPTIESSVGVVAEEVRKNRQRDLDAGLAARVIAADAETTDGETPPSKKAAGAVKRPPMKSFPDIES